MIRYDEHDLTATADRLGEAVAVARDVEGSGGALTGGMADCGDADLADAARSLMERWGYGMGVVAEDADALAGALRDSADTYAGIDGAGAAQLRGSGSW